MIRGSSAVVTWLNSSCQFPLSERFNTHSILQSVFHQSLHLYHGAVLDPLGDVTIGRAVIVFSCSEAAEQRIAGLPAAARAVRQIARMGLRKCWIVVGEHWLPAPSFRAAVSRTAGPMKVRFVADFPRRKTFSDDTLLISGEHLIDLEAQLVDEPAEWTKELTIIPAGAELAWDQFTRARDFTNYAKAEREIIRATAKTTDGIVARHINRPISQAISARLLHVPWITPGHATFGNVLLGLTMIATLILLPPQLALMAGALLFQAASILDGVDGEIARATSTQTQQGAMFDSLVDAATNLAFVAGVVLNLHLLGEETATAAGIVGLSALVTGLVVIGLRARAEPSRAFTFNEMKDRVQAANVPVLTWLTWLTMRDFYALAAALAVILGFAAQAVIAFAIVALGWVATVLFMSFCREGTTRSQIVEARCGLDQSIDDLPWRWADAGDNGAAVVNGLRPGCTKC
jgi:1L-myo-inositol 1-phosphate cytidylyltransferase / CDP-L-myo-inositol myo-inositolphosphotransferase